MGPLPGLEGQEIEVTTGRCLGDVSAIQLNITPMIGPSLVTSAASRGHLITRDRDLDAPGVGVDGDEVTVAHESYRSVEGTFRCGV